MDETWPFTGRDQDLARTLHTLRTRGAVVLGGAAGVGKSRLAREVATRVPDGILGVVRATASAREVPLGAFVDLLTGTGEPDLARAVRTLGGEHDRRVIVVDDAHLLDPLSAAAVHQLAAARRARMVVTVRSGEPAPDAITALWKDDLATRLEIAPFDPERTRSLLVAVLGAGLEATTAKRLHQTTRGNVLWLRHLVGGERAAGRLRCDDGAWVWRGTPELSPALDSLVAARIGTLTDPQRRVLELLAVAEPLGLGMLEELSSAKAVEEVAERELVRVERDRRRVDCSLAHPLYGDVVRAHTSAPRTRRLCSEVSDALARTGGRRAGDDLRRAVLDLDGDRPLDPGHLLQASMRATALGDIALSERLLRAAVDAGGGFLARVGLAHLLTWLLREQEADGVLADAVAAARTPEDRVRAVTLRVLHHHLQASTPRDGEDLLAAEEAGHRDPAYDAVRGSFVAGRGDLRRGLAVADAVLADPDRRDMHVVLACWYSSLGRALSGRADGLRVLVERGIAVAAEVPEIAAMASNIGYFEVVDADLRGAPDDVGHRLDWAASRPGSEGAVFVAIYDGRVRRCRGLPRAAAELMTSALPAFPGHGGGWGAWLTAQVSQCHAMLGEPAEARRWLAEAERRRHPHVPVLDFEIDLARAWTAAAEGALRQAVASCRDGAERCARIGAYAAEVLLRQTAVRFGDTAQEARLAELASRLDSPRATLAAAHAAALATGDPEGLLEVAGRLADTGTVLEAADAAGQAAVAARARNRLVLAAEAEDRARTLTAPGHGRTPAVLEAGAPVRLSEREREVAALAGAGLTNRQIAERLQVSVRTVESHVYRACARLGLPDRAAFVAVARADVGSVRERGGSSE